MLSYADKIKAAADAVAKQLNENFDSALILGSGLSHLFADADTDILNYQQIPNMPAPAVLSHQGTLSSVKLNNNSVAICRGRVHLYEGHAAEDVAFMVYVLSQLGVQKLVITNAAGALNPNYSPGDIMIIQDHINHTGRNPVVGQDDTLGMRFTDMSQAYPPTLAAEALRCGSNFDLNVHLGIYAGVLGPTLETSAERRMLRAWGADAVGMSTVIEVIAANHCGMEVIGLSAITNIATGASDQPKDSVDDILKNAAYAASGIEQIAANLLK